MKSIALALISLVSFTIAQASVDEIKNRKDERERATVVVASNATENNEKCPACGGDQENEKPQTETDSEVQS
jgi:hypothetical protein